MRRRVAEFGDWEGLFYATTLVRARFRRHYTKRLTVLDKWVITDKAHPVCGHLANHERMAWIKGQVLRMRRVRSSVGC